LFFMWQHTTEERTTRPVMDEHQLFLEYIRELRKETARGAVIISGVVIGDLLGKTLEQYLTDHKDVKQLLHGGVSAPLGSLSSRILMAFGLRLIDEREYKNLQIIRKIRNHFAHSLHASFDDQNVVDWCKQLDATGILPRALETIEQRFRSVATLQMVLLRNAPGAAAGKKMAEAGWQDRVRKHLREYFKRKEAEEKEERARKKKISS
jgi:mannitol operon repressor